MRIKRTDPAFSDARNMRPGDIITYDPSKEGTGERAEGKIKEISRTFLSLVLEDGTPIGVARVYTCRHPGETNQASLPPANLPKGYRERRWPPPKRERYVSFPF